MPAVTGRRTECRHRRCGVYGANVARHEFPDGERDPTFERVCDGHVDEHENDPTFAGWV